MKKLNPINGTAVIFLLITTLLILSGCANNEVVTQCLKGQTYGFWGGLWHGIIAPIDLIAILWRDDVSVFAPNNNGIWYAFGFILGSGGWGFLGGHGASKSYKKR
ncbi:MAG: hypothetical protein NT004_01035 [Bacteroidetes bacterium]|nr:hypothetical protein [Bacteroidota bacterium]